MALAAPFIPRKLPQLADVLTTTSPTAGDDLAHNGSKWAARKNQFGALIAPTGLDDFASGYEIGSRWTTTGGAVYTCVGDGSWANLSTTATPGGSSGELQYNSSGSFAGITNTVVDPSYIRFDRELRPNQFCGVQGHSNGDFGLAITGGNGAVEWWFDSEALVCTKSSGGYQDYRNLRLDGRFVSARPSVAHMIVTRDGGAFPFNFYEHVVIGPSTKAGAKVVIGRSNAIVVDGLNTGFGGQTSPSYPVDITGDLYASNSAAIGSAVSPSGTDGRLTVGENLIINGSSLTFPSTGINRIISSGGSSRLRFSTQNTEYVEIGPTGELSPLTNNTQTFGSAINQWSTSAIQLIHSYRTFSNGSNYERGKFGWNGTTLEIGAEAAGPGVVRNVNLIGANVAVPNGGLLVGASGTPQGAIQLRHDSTYSTSYGGLNVSNNTTPAKVLELGYDGTADIAYLQSAHVGVANKDVILQPRGGGVGVGVTSVSSGYKFETSGKIKADGGLGITNFYIDDSASMSTGVWGNNTSSAVSLRTGNVDRITAGNARSTITNLVNHDVATELTIAAGAVTVTKSHHVIDTQGDATTDDLDTISGMSEGDELWLRAAHTDRTVVIKHGTGNIETSDGSDITLDDASKMAHLFHNGAVIRAVTF